MAPHDWIRRLPKAELHLHLEGTLEPEMMLTFARRNRVELALQTVEQIRAAYEFEKLDDFLAIYYQGMSVLQTAEDFHELTAAYLQRARADGVVHVEVFFDPQGHTRRGVELGTVIHGIVSGLNEASSLGMTAKLILCFLRDLPESDALETLEHAEPWLEHLTGVGLDSSEVVIPPPSSRGYSPPRVHADCASWRMLERKVRLSTCARRSICCRWSGSIMATDRSRTTHSSSVCGSRRWR